MAQPPSDLTSVDAPQGKAPPADLMQPPSDLGGPPPAPSAPGMDLTPKPTRSPMDRLKDVGMSTGAGLAIGAVAPEITTGVGYGMMAFPPTAPFAPAVIGAGQAMRGARLAQAGLGALSGFGEEVAGQTAEKMGYGKTGQEVARLAGGAVTPEFANLVKWAGGKLIGVTGIATKSDITGIVSALTKDMGLEEKQLSPSQRKYIEQVAEQIRGGARSDQFAKTVYSALERGTVETVDRYNAQARQLEQQAQEMLRGAEAAAAGRTAEAQRRVSTLQSQFEASAQQLTETARQRANNIIKGAEDIAAKNRAAVAQSAPASRQITEIENRALIERARKEADAVIADARNRVTRMRDIATRARASGAQRMEAAGREVSAVGTPTTPTQTGTQIRDAVTPIFENLKKVRAANAEKTKGDAFSFAAQKEARGILPKDTEAFKTGLAQLDKLIADTTLADIKAPLVRIRQALDPVQVIDGVVVGKPAKFESLEQVRRFLRDRSYGLPAEGFDAINQQQSGRLADMVESIQREFTTDTPSLLQVVRDEKPISAFDKFLEQYRKDSEPLRVFKTKLGEAIVGKEEFDMGRFATDPATLGSKFFKTEGGVNQLVELLGGDKSQAEQIARGFVADNLRGASSKDVARKLNEWRDWLPQFPGLQAQLQNAEKQLAQAERISGKREATSKALRGEAAAAPAAAERTAARIEADAERQAAKLEAQGQEAEAALLRKQAAEEARQLSAAQREAGAVERGAEAQVAAGAKAVERQKTRLETEAEKAGRKEIGEAEREAGRLQREAGKLSTEGERVRQEIMGKTFDARRVREIILSGDRRLWSEVGPMISADPAAKAAFGDALRQVVSEKATMSPASIRRVFAEDIRPAMEATGLLSRTELAKLESQIDLINKTVEGPKRVPMVIRLVTNALTGEAARVPGAVAGAISGKETEGR